MKHILGPSSWRCLEGGQVCGPHSSGMTARRGCHLACDKQYQLCGPDQSQAGQGAGGEPGDGKMARGSCVGRADFVADAGALLGQGL